jgi:hypothetical protein
MGCGKRRVELVLLALLFEGGLLPQADTWMGTYCCGFIRGDFIFFIPSPLCHAFLPGNSGIFYVIYIIFGLCMALLNGNNEMHK